MAFLCPLGVPATFRRDARALSSSSAPAAAPAAAGLERRPCSGLGGLAFSSLLENADRRRFFGLALDIARPTTYTFSLPAGRQGLFVLSEGSAPRPAAAAAGKKLKNLKPKGAKKSKKSKDGAPVTAPTASSPAVARTLRHAWAAPDDLFYAPPEIKEKYSRVYTDGKDYYAVFLNITDISHEKQGHNKFYVMQLLEERARPGKFVVYTRWGRNGLYEKPPAHKIKECDGLEGAKKLFKEKFKEKTGNVFGEPFVHLKHRPGRPGKPLYDVVEFEYGPSAAAGCCCEDEGVDCERVWAAAWPGRPNPLAGCALEPAVRGFLELVLLRAALELTLLNIGVDVGYYSVPVGKLSKRQIAKGLSILRQIRILELGEGGPALLEGLSSLFYTAVPHGFGSERPPVVTELRDRWPGSRPRDFVLDRECAYIAVLVFVALALRAAGSIDDAQCLQKLGEAVDGLRGAIPDYAETRAERVSCMAGLLLISAWNFGIVPGNEPPPNRLGPFAAALRKQEGHVVLPAVADVVDRIFAPLQEEAWRLDEAPRRRKSLPLD
eukprot:tig00020878_g14869.t1